MTPTVIDLSHYQPHVDLLTARNNGILGVIHKATEGTGWSDGLYKARKANAATLRLAFAPYHFLKPGNIPNQAAKFIQFAQPPKGGRVFIDYEDDGLKLDDLKTMIKAVLTLDPTLQIGIYGGALLKQQVGDTKDLDLGRYPLWLAQYTTGTPSWPKNTWPYWSLWQYTDAADVPGVGKCDGNVFNGSNENLMRFLDPVDTAPAPVAPPVEPAEPVDEVSIDIRTPPGMPMHIFVNGVQVS